jgi:hypothetical protein
VSRSFRAPDRGRAGWALAAVAAFIFFGRNACGNEGDMDVRIWVDEQLVRDLETLKGRRVFFGHHSVGRDILAGVGELSIEAGVDAKIGEGPIGQNHKPLEKIRDFEQQVLSSDVELALMKLCYVDFHPDTNVDALVTAYRDTVERLRRERPGLRIVHVTAPLHARQSDTKAKLNRLLGRLVWEDESNLRRLELSEKLRAAFPTDPFFDLATVQSTRPDGSREIHLVGNRQVPMLWPGYTNDGGHLNDTGKRVAAKAFIHALAQALRR